MSVVEDYLQANADYEAAKRDLKKATSILRDVADAITNYPGEFQFSNCPTPVPMEIAMNQRTKSLDANDWPSADHIQRLVVRRLETRQRATEAWGKVPKDLRASLVPPKH